MLILFRVDTPHCAR